MLFEIDSCVNFIDLTGFCQHSSNIIVNWSFLIKIFLPDYQALRGRIKNKRQFNRVTSVFYPMFDVSYRGNQLIHRKRQQEKPKIETVTT